LQDTLETSLFAPHLFQTDDGPATSHPTPLPEASFCRFGESIQPVQRGIDEPFTGP